ncbi:hypothetical protein LPB072_03195 [Hydrogenophaga crassostreae]|uniref:DUF5648 domain-containing protein n=2 Tax=Hydrogenophaga crassostreae TaxID=1763535 RepID=A0A1D8NSE2_9BURK|nr:hypothetical protein LPB072_03195 [Hydrogenophaga crassostreae]
MLLSCVALAALTACGGGQQDDAPLSRFAIEETTSPSPSSEQAPVASILEGLAAQFPNGQLPKEQEAQAALELEQNPAVLSYTADEEMSVAKLAEEVSDWMANATRKVLGQKLGTTPLYRPVVRFRTPSGYFYTASPAEIATITSQQPTWIREGTAMHGSSESNWGLSPVYRFRNNATGSYIYTISPTEKQAIVDNLSATFTLDGAAWYSSSSAGSGFSPVYRFRNILNGSYLWTGSEAEKEAIVANYSAIFAFEGVAFHTPIAAPNEVFVETPIKLNNGILGDKPKIQRQGDGTLVVAYGDAPDGAGMVYDVKGQNERPARDIFVKTCKPSATKTCNLFADWSAPINVSKSALMQSTGSFDWRGTLGNPGTYPGDIDKANIKTTGPIITLTWVSKYCPDGDPSTAAIELPVQRAVRYLERNDRVIPFSCAWTSYSTTKGTSWSPAKQLSSGERDAIQDASSGSISTDTSSASYNKGQIVYSWQEDPQGLALGEADGPGDGASGANVNGGTDVWYSYATVDLTQTPAPAPGAEYNTTYYNLRPSQRLTDNWTNQYGINGSVNYIYDGSGTNVPESSIEKGQTGAARPNIGMVGSTTIVAYEETKGSNGLDDGKFVRYHAFPYATVPATAAGKAGCIISDPSKNARRVRFLTQSPTDAGTGGIQIGIFWKEGSYDKGGPSDIRVRRGMGGLQPANLLPAVDANCATSDYATAIGLTSTKGDNISSKAPTATVANLTDNTELNYTENALAHRGVLRGEDMWIGYNYTGDLVKLWAGLDNYNFWIRRFNMTTGWDNPKNVTNITNKGINVREPRIFGTPKSNQTSCPTGNPADASTTNPADCQNANVVYLAWGTQTNVSPYDPAGGQDLGEFITVSRDSAASFAPVVKLSAVQGVYWGDQESAYESQNVTNPDGSRFYSVWNQKVLTTDETQVEFVSGNVLAP